MSFHNKPVRSFSDLETSSVKPKARRIYISTILSMAMLLFTLGLLVFAVMQQRRLSDRIKEKIAINVFFTEKAAEIDVLKVKAQLSSNPHVKKIRYVDKKQAAESLQKDLGENFLKFLGTNPLLYSLEIYMKAPYGGKKYIEEITKQLAANPKIKEVLYNPILIEDLHHSIKVIGFTMLAFGMLMFVLSIALITNTVNLSVFSERFIIKSMRLIGATKSMIRRPYLRLGVLYGLLSALLAIAGFLTLYFILHRSVPEITALFALDWKQVSFLFTLILSMGVLISCISTWASVNRYLKHNTLDMYV